MEANNINGYAAHLRDTFLKAEREYVMALLEIDEVVDVIRQLNSDYSGESLFSAAKNLIDRVDNGEFDEEEMVKVEYQITVLLAAIQDKILIKVLERIMEKEEKNHYLERSR